MKIMSFDLGYSSSPIGWAFLDEEAWEGGWFDGKHDKKPSMHVLYNEVMGLLDLWKPEKIGICRPMGRFGVVHYQQGKQAGVITFIAERRGIPIVEKPDSQFRFKHFGRKMTKKAAQALMAIDNEHVSDALIASFAIQKHPEL